MIRTSPLEGSCSCGRNHYTITIPPNATQTASVFFSHNTHHRRALSTPLSSFLRIPLTWYTSRTTSFFTDETPPLIRRSYTSPEEQNAKRHFCGYCGTPLTYWTEEPRGEGDWICLTLGTLEGRSLRDLEEWGVIDGEALHVHEYEEEKGEDVEMRDGVDGRGHDGIPWFRSLVEGSQLGALRRESGSERSRDGRVTVEWEITEWKQGDGVSDGEILRPSGGGNENASGAKRKLGDVAAEDEKMEGAQ